MTDGANKPDGLLVYLRRRFPHIAIGITILIGAAAGLGWIVDGAEKIKKVMGWFEPAKQILPYMEIVFDRSKRMEDKLGDEPEKKWAVAIAGIDHVDFPSNGYLALRSFGGGSCEDNPGSPELKFTLNGKERLNAMLKKLTPPSGEGSLVKAVIAAIDDFNNMAKFKDVPRRVVVITGGVDACTSDPVGVIQEHVRRQPPGYDVSLDFRFIGVGLGASEKERLKSITEAAKGKLVIVNNREELDQALNIVLVLEPMEHEIGAMLGTLNDCIDRLNKVIGDLGLPGAGTADADFRAAQAECNRPKPRFDPKFKQLHEATNRAIEMRVRIVEVTKKLVTQKNLADVEGYNLSVKEFKDLAATYNRDVVDLNTALQKMKSNQETLP